MKSQLRNLLTKGVQRVFWPYVTDNFLIEGAHDFRRVEPSLRCQFMSITLDNYHRVREFRNECRCDEYRAKVCSGEIGYFAECDHEIVGSIWATINRQSTQAVVRAYMPLMPNEAMIHDVVTADRFRGMGIGPFMVGEMAACLLDEHHVNKIIVDISAKNKSSRRMMQKAGSPLKERVLYLSMFGNLIYHKVLRRYPA